MISWLGTKEYTAQSEDLGLVRRVFASVPNMQLIFPGGSFKMRLDIYPSSPFRGCEYHVLCSLRWQSCQTHSFSVKQLVLLPGLSHNTLQFLIPDVCSKLLCFKTWHHQLWWWTPLHLSWQSILLSYSVRLYPGGRSGGHCPRRLSLLLSYIFPSLPAHTTKIVLCVLSPRSLLMADWAISTGWVLSMGRNSMRLFAPELLCTWHSVKQKGMMTWSSLKGFMHCSRTRSSSLVN